MPKRKRDLDVDQMSKDELLETLKANDATIATLEEQQEKAVKSPVKISKGNETMRRHQVLLMRLCARDHEVQSVQPFLRDAKQQNSDIKRIRKTFFDPLLKNISKHLSSAAEDVEQKKQLAKDDLQAWQFNGESVEGKQLVATCKSLLEENGSLGAKLSQESISQLESELAIATAYNSELQTSQVELTDFASQLDEEMQAMQSTIMGLQHDILKAKHG